MRRNREQVINDSMESVYYGTATCTDPTSRLTISDIAMMSPLQHRNLYRSSGVFKTPVNRIASECTRTSHVITVRGIDYTTTEISKFMDGEANYFSINNELYNCMVRSLWGGAGFFVLVEDSKKVNLSSPLQAGAKIANIIGTGHNNMRVRAVGKDPLSRWCGKPIFYQWMQNLTLPKSSNRAGYDKIHASRVVSFPAFELEPEEIEQTGLAGDSLYTAIYKILNRFAMADAEMARMLSRLGIVTVGLKNKELKEAQDFALAEARYESIADNLGSLGALFHSEEEIVNMLSPSVSGVKDLLDHLKTSMALQLDMPKSLLFGEEAPGLFADGKSPWDAHYNSVYTRFRNTMDPGLRHFYYAILSGSKEFRGLRPSDITVTINPLNELSEKELATLDLVKAQTALMLSQVGAKSATDGGSISNTTKDKSLSLGINSPENTGLTRYQELSAISTMTIDSIEEDLFVLSKFTAGEDILAFQRNLNNIIPFSMAAIDHVTVFAVSAPTEEQMVAAHSAVALSPVPYRFLTTNLDVFYNTEAGVYAIVLKCDMQTCELLNNVLNATILENNVSKFSRNFVPHITLGYTKEVDLFKWATIPKVHRFGGNFDSVVVNNAGKTIYEKSLNG